MIQFTDTKTNKTYTFKSLFIPLSRIADVCQDGEHSKCTSSPQHLIKFLDIDLTKSMCCLCNCHGKEVK